MAQAKLIVVIFGPGNKNFIKMCLDSVKKADEVLYFTDNVETVKKYYSNVFFNEWDESDKATNGKSRNVYLKYLKEKYPNDWCLVVDEDEIVDNIQKVKDFIKTAMNGVYSVKMRHFIGSLGQEDATREIHHVPNRLFKISNAKEYPLHSHPILIATRGSIEDFTECTTIWHMGHLPIEYMDYILKRYKQHQNDSVIHTEDFLKRWRNAHLFGRYPVKPVSPLELPKQLTERYEIDKDELYFESRRFIETKHFLDAINWKDYFKPKKVKLYGCGFGQRLYCLNQLGVDAYGEDISEFVVYNGLFNNRIEKGDITIDNKDGKTYDLVVAYDVLEHVDKDKIDDAINNLINHSSKYILISVPVLGNPQLDADITHKVRESEEWWLDKFISKGLIREFTPVNFLFREQVYIFRKP